MKRAVFFCLVLASCRMDQPCLAADASCSNAASLLYLAQLRQDWLVAVGNSGMVYYSSDLGRTWNSGTSGVIDNLTGVVHVADGRWVAVGASDRMLYSDDGGKTWKPANTPSTGGVNHQALAVGNGILLSAGTVVNVFLSTDKGLTWVSTSSPVAAVKNNADFACGRFLFASNAQVAISADGSGAVVSSTLPSFPTGKAACLGNRMVVASGASPFAHYSDDLGTNWTGATATMGAIRRAIRKLDTQLLAFGDDLLVYRSSDGINWSAGTAIPAGNVKDAAAIDSRRMAVVGGAASATVFYTEDGAQSWTQVTGFPALAFNSVSYGRIPYF